MAVSEGRILLVQEARFRLRQEDGRVFLFTLSRSAKTTAADLQRWRAERVTVTVEYEGKPNHESGIAQRVQPVGIQEVSSGLQGERTTASEKLSGAFRDWALPRQLLGEDPLGRAAESAASRSLRPRLEEADRVGTSICPYCSVGCAQLVYARGNDVVHVEGDPQSPINQGTLCAKGAATFGWLANPERLTTVKYRAPYSEAWEEKPLDWAMDRIAFLVKRTRDETFVRDLPDGTTVNHTMGIASLGGATLDNEENYLIKKLCAGGLGMVWVENQARV
jgi:formate dehydrogenase major subunit